MSLQQEIDFIIHKNKNLPETPNELTGIQPRASLSTIFEESESMESSTPPEYGDAVQPSILPDYNINDSNTNNLPSYKDMVNDIIVADNLIDPTDEILATIVEGNLPTRLANKLEYQLD
jgi:hypothetical protein